MRGGLPRRSWPGQRPCYTRAVQTGPAARVFVMLGITLLLIAALATVWHLFAAQLPSSAYHVSALPGPVAQLRDGAAFLGLAVLVLAALRPWLGEPEPLRLAIATCVGSAVTIGGLAWGATTGMYGLQIEDPRHESVQIFALRAAGETVLAICFVLLAARIVRRASKP